ncbi:hypothetical protein [Dietzia maris]|uniref:hypothetical protein n=1 Tax=Dietzia maris TaxID=37915 RepID=UPI0037C50876
MSHLDELASPYGSPLSVWNSFLIDVALAVSPSDPSSSTFDLDYDPAITGVALCSLYFVTDLDIVHIQLSPLNLWF